MSMTSNLVDELRKYAEEYKNLPWREVCEKTKRMLNQAADTIEELSLKLHNSQMERSSQYYGGWWIPCSERLPDDDVPVLVTFVDKDDKKYTDVAITSYGQEYFGGKPLNSKDWKPPFRYFENNYKIIAWRPLPPAYEPKED